MAWRQSSKPSNELKRNDSKALCYRLSALLAYTKPAEYHAVFMKFSEFLDDCLKECPSPEATEAFKKSVPSMNISRIVDRSVHDDDVMRDDEPLSVGEELGLPVAVLP